MYPPEPVDPPAAVHHDVPFSAFWRLLVIALGLSFVWTAAAYSNRVFGGQNENPALSILIWLAMIAFGVWWMARGLLIPAHRWLVTPGRIEIASRNPFRENLQVIPADHVAKLSVYEDRDVETYTRWGVTIETVAGRQFHGRGFKSKDEAQQLLARIESTLRR